MAVSTDGMELGFATLDAVTFPASGGTIASACGTIELALRGTLRIADRDLHPDEIVAHRHGELLARPSSSGSTLVAIGVHPDAPIAQSFLRRLRRVEIVRVPSLPRFRLDLTGQLGIQDSQRSMALGGVVMNLVAECIRCLKTEAESPMQTVLEVLDREFRNPLTIAELAARVGMRPTTLATRFHREIGMTIGAYTRQKRVELARSLLVETDMGVADIARAAGFYDQSHLDRCFRRVSGTTPTALRRSAKRA
jgi:AraC-like DNA-binding protein